MHACLRAPCMLLSERERPGCIRVRCSSTASAAGPGGAESRSCSGLVPRYPAAVLGWVAPRGPHVAARLTAAPACISPAVGRRSRPPPLTGADVAVVLVMLDDVLLARGCGGREQCSMFSWQD